MEVRDGCCELEASLVAAEVEGHVHDLARASVLMDPPIVEDVIAVASQLPKLEATHGKRVATAPKLKEPPVAGQERASGRDPGSRR